MPKHDKRVTVARSDLGLKCRDFPRDHPEVLAARERLAAANEIVRRDRAIDMIVELWDELTHEQAARIIKLVRAPAMPRAPHIPASIRGGR
jgi:hypothetical protein